MLAHILWRIKHRHGKPRIAGFTGVIHCSKCGAPYKPKK